MKMYIEHLLPLFKRYSKTQYFEKDINNATSERKLYLELSKTQGVRKVSFKSILFCTTTGYFLPFFSSLLKKEGRRKGE